MGNSIRIAINFPSNIGDAIIALPVLDALRQAYPQSQITAVVSPKTSELFSRNASISQMLVFDKKWDLGRKRDFAFSLRGKYDIFADLKNTFLPIVAGVKKCTPFFRKRMKNIHARDQYLALIRLLAVPHGDPAKSEFTLTPEEKAKWDNQGLVPSLVIACASMSSLKQYPYRLLKQVVGELSGQYPIIVVGQERDREYYQDILTMKNVRDLVGKTGLHEVFYLFKQYAITMLCADSGLMHIGSYLGLPIAALFGPSDPVRFGPWSDGSVVLRDETLNCLACKASLCGYNYRCMDIAPDRVIRAVKEISRETKR